jgi:CDGSH-type Zn-finger protein
MTRAARMPARVPAALAALTLAALAAAFVACGHSRALDIELTGSDAALASVGSISVEVYDRAQCRCRDLDVKPGCDPAHARARFALSPGFAQSSIDSDVSSELTVRAHVYDKAGAPLPLAIDCWCTAPGATTLVFPLVPSGGVAVPPADGGAGCE